MEKLFTFALAIAVSVATTVALSDSRNAMQPNRSANALATDGAFRDGLFVGRLAAESGRAMEPPIGRWSTSQDRASFDAGYRSAYQQSLAAHGRNRP